VNQPNRADLRAMLTLEEVADVLRCARSTIYALMGSGELPFVRIRGIRRVEVAALEEFVERHRSGPRTSSTRRWGRKGTYED